MVQIEYLQLNPIDAISEPFGSLVRCALLRGMLKPSLMLI